MRLLPEKYHIVLVFTLAMISCSGDEASVPPDPEEPVYVEPVIAMPDDRVSSGTGPDYTDQTMDLVTAEPIMTVDPIVIAEPVFTVDPVATVDPVFSIDPDSAGSVLDLAVNVPDYQDGISAQVEAPGASVARQSRIEEYRIVLGADETLKIPGLPGELRVWIGSPHYQASIPERMVQDEATIPALGETAKVEPFAPAFIIDPPETECILIHPSGSEVRFTLLPKKKGTFEVGANVYLFESDDCSGTPIPKTASTLSVLVEVNRKDIVMEKLKELGSVLWEHFVDFWGMLLVILFGLVLFMIRGKLKKWFGYDE